MQLASPRLFSFALATGLLAASAFTGACSSDEPELLADAGTSSGFGNNGSTSSSSSGGSSSSSGGGSSSSSSSGGGSSSSGGEACNDPDDVSDMQSPQPLPPAEDTTDTLTDITGVISTDDEDAYQRLITDETGGFLDPTASTTAVNVQLCLFLECSAGKELTINECQEGSVAFNYSATKKGCCGTAIKVNYDCSGTTDDVQTYIRVLSTVPQCTAYTINVGQ